MKRAISVILTLFIMLTLAVPCFAAGPAKFALNVVSENDKEIVLSLDYEGGSSFQNFDFELKYNAKKLKATEAIDGDGSLAFQQYAKKQSGMFPLSAINKDINPIKASFAALIPFKTVQGKDIFTFKFQKINKAKITASDITLTFTVCQLNDNNVQTSVSTSLIGNSTAPTASQEKPVDPTQATNKAPDKTDKPDASAASSDGATGDAVNSDDPISTPINEDVELVDGNGAATPDGNEAYEETTDKNEDNNNTKKIIIVAAAAVCVLAVAVVAVIVIKKKADAEA